MKTLFPFASFLSVLPVMAAEPVRTPENKDADYSRLTVRASDECLLLANKDCNGQRKQISYTTASGYFLSVETFADNAHLTPFDKTFAHEDVGRIHGDISWRRAVTGSVARLGKAFHPTNNSTFQAEFYIGKIEGSVHVNAKADVTLNPQSLTIPAFGYGGYNFAGKTYTFKGLHKEARPFNYDVAGKTLYGGLRQHFGTSFAPHPNAHILLNQFAHVGVEKLSYGGGVGFAYTSEPDNRLGAKLSGICQRGDTHSTARFTFAIAACAEKVKHDVLYDKMYEKSGQWAGRINEYIAGGQAAIDKVNGRIGTDYNLPTTNAGQIMKGLDIHSPYDHLNASFVVAASMNLNGYTVTLARNQPLKSSRDGNATTSLTLGKNF